MKDNKLNLSILQLRIRAKGESEIAGEFREKKKKGYSFRGPYT